METHLFVNKSMQWNPSWRSSRPIGWLPFSSLFGLLFILPGRGKEAGHSIAGVQKAKRKLKEKSVNGTKTLTLAAFAMLRRVRHFIWPPPSEASPAVRPDRRHRHQRPHPDRAGPASVATFAFPPSGHVRPRTRPVRTGSWSW